MLLDVYLHMVLKPPQRGAKPITLDPQTNKLAYEQQVWRLQDSSTLSGSLCVFSTWLKGLTIVHQSLCPWCCHIFRHQNMWSSFLSKAAFGPAAPRAADHSLPGCAATVDPPHLSAHLLGNTVNHEENGELKGREKKAARRLEPNQKSLSEACVFAAGGERSVWDAEVRRVQPVWDDNAGCCCGVDIEQPWACTQGSRSVSASGRQQLCKASRRCGDPGIKWTNVGTGCCLQEASIHRSLETCSLHLMFPNQIRNLHWIRFIQTAMHLFLYSAIFSKPLFTFLQTHCERAFVSFSKTRWLNRWRPVLHSHSSSSNCEFSFPLHTSDLNSRVSTSLHKRGANFWKLRHDSCALLRKNEEEGGISMCGKWKDRRRTPPKWFLHEAQWVDLRGSEKVACASPIWCESLRMRWEHRPTEDVSQPEPLSCEIMHVFADLACKGDSERRKTWNRFGIRSGEIVNTGTKGSLTASYWL